MAAVAHVQQVRGSVCAFGSLFCWEAHGAQVLIVRFDGGVERPANERER